MNEIIKNSVEISSTLDNVAKIEMATEHFFQNIMLDQKMYGNILLSVVEASENAIRHGNNFDSHKKVNVSFNKNNTTITIKIKDEGKGFNYKTIPNPILKQNIEKPNGRGIFIISNLADKLEFNDKGNEIIMTFNIN